MVTGRGKKYIDLLKEKQVERWFRDCARGSQLTADVILRRLGSFCNEVSKTPMDLLELSDESLTNLLTDFIGTEEDRGLSPNYINSSVKAVKSWLSFNGRKLIRKLKIKNAGVNTRYGNESIPSQQSLKKIFSVGDARSKTACALIAFSGLRLEALGDYMGKGGLEIRDLPEMHVDVDSKTVSFENEVTMVKVRPELSKTRKPYITFIGPEGTGYLSAYLQKRMIEGEVLMAESPIIVPSKLALRKKHITTINIGDLIRQSIRSAGFENRPYILRSYFDTQLMLAESKGFIMHDYRVFMMGHSGSMEHRYTLDKMLTSDTIEDMRSSYVKCLKFLETEDHGIKEEDVAKITTNTMKETAIMILETAYGTNLSDKEKEDLMALDLDDLQERLKEIFRDKKAEILNNGNRHKTIPERELEIYLNKGWELVQIYPKGDKAVVKLPS
ncbi:site-specific integrase [Cuniculiplasma divulgatum]|uniref:Integrase n=1 Tax=Cuniculiplasma divulgatum TaxID=1673428 RepID=A0A1N5TM31_9ARCH|nr:site-specific integrase [Cuniculiplasma divulgatum]SIM49522.1 integrase [Cuniculiplasma divulgatum]